MWWLGLVAGSTLQPGSVLGYGGVMGGGWFNLGRLDLFGWFDLGRLDLFSTDGRLMCRANTQYVRASRSSAALLSVAHPTRHSSEVPAHVSALYRKQELLLVVAETVGVDARAQDSL